MGEARGSKDNDEFNKETYKETIAFGGKSRRPTKNNGMLCENFPVESCAETFPEPFWIRSRGKVFTKNTKLITTTNKLITKNTKLIILY